MCELLSQLDDKKAIGLDGVPCKLLKLASSIIRPSLTEIFNSCIDTGTFPDEWKIAKVTPIFKKDQNLTRITIDQFLDKNKLLNIYQSGFRSLRSTMTTLLETMNNS